jgi:hypothetical protein
MSATTQWRRTMSSDQNTLPRVEVIEGKKEMGSIKTKHIKPNLIHQRLPVDGIATRYELDGPGILSLWGKFSAPVQTGPGAHPTCYTLGTGVSFAGRKRLGRGVDHPPHLAQRLKKE